MILNTLILEKFKNKYRIASARLQEYDYRQNGAYFITICTENREHHFGTIQHGKMQLSPCGVLADIFWHEIKHHTTGVELGAFVVMPNHVHGILILKEVWPPTLPISTPRDHNEQMAVISPKPGSISTIIRSYKSAVTKHANRLGLPNGWQSRFHDHIIRNEVEYWRIYHYILNNPANWEKDKFAPSHEKPDCCTT